MIDNRRLPDIFINACRGAAWHINECSKKYPHLAERQNFGWVRTTQHFPLVEHLSFNCGSTLYFVFVDMEISPVLSLNPDARQRYLDVCILAKAVPCYISMQKLETGQFIPTSGGWGLRHFITHEEIDPIASYSEENVEISDWELHDFAIKRIVDIVEKDGFNLASVQSYLGQDPSIWVEGEGGLTWLLVRAGRGIQEFPKLPPESDEIIRAVNASGLPIRSAAFISVNIWDPYNAGDPAILYRRRGLATKFRKNPDTSLKIFEFLDIKR